MSTISIDILTIKDKYTVSKFKEICDKLRSKNSFRERFICLFKKIDKTSFNYERLKKILLDVQIIYKELLETYSKDELKDIIRDEDFDFINYCIKEHDDFCIEMKKIINTNPSYVKTVIKDKAYLYITDIVKYLSDNGMLATLEKIILEDKIQLHTLNCEYFDNLISFALVDDRLKLKNQEIYLADIFDLADILIAYDKLLNKVHLDNYYPSIFGEDIERIVKLSNEARYLHGLRPGQITSLLNKEGLTQDQIKENMSRFIKVYEFNDTEKERLKKENEIKNAEAEVEKNSDIVLKFISSKFLSVKEYLKISKVDKNRFEKAVAIIRDNNHPTYEEYIKKLDIADERINFPKILDSIKNGVVVSKEKGIVRKFDLIDYYEITKVTPSEAKKLADDKLTRREYGIISNFFKKYSSDNPITNDNKDNYLKMNLGYPINGVEVFATDDDKKTVMLELVEREIPLTEYTYKSFLKRYIFDKYKPDDEKTLKPRKKKEEL